MGLLDGKTAFISGGSRGIGRALCDIFAREGADIAFSYHSNEEAAKETIALIEGHGRKGLSYQVSVTDKVGIKGMLADVLANYGKVDILVNNAAINRGDSFVTTMESSWLDVVNTNVNGLYYMTKPFLKQMMKQKSGNILNISSIGAIRAVPTSVHYATTKAAVIGFTKCLSREAVQFGVTVNCITAGLFETDLGDALPDYFRVMYQNWSMRGRYGDPKELAEFAAFMVSDRNSYMVGEVITIDGGTIV